MLTVCLTGLLARPAGAQAAGDADARELARVLLGARLTLHEAGLDRLLRTRVETYDLTAVTRKVVAELPADKHFCNFASARGIDPATANRLQLEPLMNEYMQTSTNIPRQIGAWLALTSDAKASWQSDYGPYQVLQQERPREFLPKLMMIARPLRTESEAAKWLELLKETYGAADSARDRTLCLMAVPLRALNLAAIDGANKCLTELDRWLEELSKSTGTERAPPVDQIEFSRFIVAYARGNYVDAADRANAPRWRTFRPLMLLLAGRSDDARRAVADLRADTTLSEREARDLEQIEALIARPPPTPDRRPGDTRG